ncbi:MAG: VCBS repeat-containing protein [Bacteroidetes bacterium]|nr:VCBS repeat-containing protein [Bacteroidota bacterium]
MKRVIFALGILFVFACSKTEVPAIPPVVVVPEETIKFTTNLDTGTYNVSDTLPLVVTVSSKLPSAGLLYSILVNWTDSSKQIFKLDTSLTTSSLSLNIPGLKKTGSYSLSVTVTSKSTSTNALNKSISVVNNPLGRFMGYKVASNARQLGTDYWNHGTGLINDLIIQTFQKTLPSNSSNSFSVQHNFISGGWSSSVCGDFNNDGYIDVFTGGGDPAVGFSFLIWNPSTKVFEDKNLFNDKSFLTILGAMKIIPVYLNGDNYVDLILIGNGENLPGMPNIPIQLAISDGKGGYDLQNITTNESDVFPPNNVPNKYGADIGDLNGDGIKDIFLACANYTYIYWGVAGFPYFTTTNHATFAPWNKDIGSLNNNSFGEKCNSCADASAAIIADLNKDGKLDIIPCGIENQTINNYTTNNTNYTFAQKLLINKGNGKFNETGVITFPFFDSKAIYENFDYVVDDINNDGLMDIITSNHQFYDYINKIPTSPLSNFFIYYQQQDGSFKIDNTSFIYASGSKTKTISNWGKPRLIYYDYNGDGIKDICYLDGSQGNEYGTYDLVANSGNIMPFKTVFIRQGNQFVEQDVYQYDPYAKSLLSILKARWK